MTVFLLFSHLCMSVFLKDPVSILIIARCARVLMCGGKGECWHHAGRAKIQLQPKLTMTECTQARE